MSDVRAITIGNFDGVHLAHAALIRAARAAVGPGGTVIAMCFDPHPAAILRPQAVPQRLSTPEQRKGWLTSAGADQVEILQPTSDLLKKSPEQFLNMVVEQYRPAFIVEGSDFRFGAMRAGSVQTLRDFEQQYGYRTIVLDAVEIALSDQSIVRVSSSMIRWLLERGRVRDASLLLGRPYELHGVVVSGDRRGRTIDMPTVNLGQVACMLPADGIYAGVARLDTHESPVGSRGPRAQHAFPAAISVGTKPSFGHHPRICEAHLIGYDGPLDDYGWPITIQFCDWLRDQLIYSDVQLLIDQLQRDVRRVMAIVHPQDCCGPQTHPRADTTLQPALAAPVL